MDPVMSVEAASPVKARRIGGEAREMTTISTRLVAYNLGYLALAWTIALGAIAAFWAHPRWYTFALAFLVVSSRQQALLNLEHECHHGKLLPTRRWNVLVGTYLCAAPVGSPFSASRARHLSHHRLLATPEDPDRELHDGPGKRSRRGLARHFIGGLLGGYAGMVLMGPPTRKSAAPGAARRDLLSLLLAQGVLAASMTIAFAWWVYPALWLLPLVTVTVLGHLVRSFAEHAVTDDERPRHGNRLITIRSNWVERFFVAPYSMNYHAEHHLLPSVPAPRLKHLQHRLAGRSDLPPVLARASYSEAIRRHVRTVAD
jgi:fatty acid desaturase